MSNILNEILGDIPTILSIAKQGAAFESGTAITIPLPAESFTVDLTAEGIGKVEVTESGTTVTIKKLA
jgi:hypothetical protein